MIFRRATTAGVLAGLLACQTTLPPAREPYAASVDRMVATGALKTTVDQLALPLIAARRNIGMVVAVSSPEGEGVFTYGSKDLAGLVPMTADAEFQVGSVSKAFTTVLAAQLEQEHRLKVDDPVGPLLPVGLPVMPGLKKVTFGELSSHTAGLPHESYTLSLLWGLVTYLVNGKSLYRYYSTTSLHEFLALHDLEREGEARYAYSNIGMTYLGWLLGLVDGKGYGRQLKEKVLDPLGLRNTGICLPETAGKNLTVGFSGDLPTFIPRHAVVEPWLFDEGIAGVGGLYSTAGDLLVFAKANVGLTPSPLLAAMEVTHKPRVAADDGHIGMGWFTKTLPLAQRPYTYIAGITGGHTSFVGFDKSRKIAVVVLQNSINHDDMIAVELLDRLVGAALVKEERSRRGTPSRTATSGAQNSK